MKELVGKLVTNVYVSDDDYYMKFDIKDSKPIVYGAYGECCSDTWFADIVVDYNFNNECREKYPLEVVSCEELDIPSWLHALAGNDGRGRQEYDEVYGFKLTFRGMSWKPHSKCEMVIIFRNSSNGAYGGSVTLVDQNWRLRGGKSVLEGLTWVKIDKSWRSE